MKKLISVQALAALTLAVAFPLAASANSASVEKAYERIQQPLNIKPSEAAQRKDTNNPAFKIDVYKGGSHAMNSARQLIQEETENPTHMTTERSFGSLGGTYSRALPHGRDW